MRRAFVVGGGGRVAAAGMSALVGRQVHPHALWLRLHPSPEVGREQGCRDATFWRRRAPDVVNFLGLHMR